MNDMEWNPGDTVFDEGMLVSPPFSCGAGFLMDILLRLEIRVRPPRIADEYWRDLPGGGFAPSGALRQHYARHAAIMQERELFTFPDRKSVMFEHRLDMVSLPARCHILLVRDPVDSLYSWHRRGKGDSKGVPFPQYLKNVSIYPHHMPHPALIASPMDAYALFVLFWIMAVENLLVVRFEDLKADPVGVMGGILAALGVERTEAEIAEAAGLSSFDAISSRPATSTDWTAMNRRSQTYEWRERMSAEERAALTASEPIATVCRLLGYEAPPEDGPPALEHGSTFGILLSGKIRALRLQCRSGTVPPQDYLLACQEVTKSVAQHVRQTEFGDTSIDAGDFASLAAASDTLLLLDQVFDGSVPQPIDRMETLMLGLSAAIANSTTGILRHMPGGVSIG